MRSTTLALGAVASSLMLAACGTDNDPAAESSDTGAAAPAAAAGVQVAGVGEVAKDEEVAKALPGDAKSTLTFATNAPYAPFIDFARKGRTDAFKGLDFDLVQAASAKLGVKVTVKQQPFDGLVPGLQAGKFDGIIGGITDTKERQQVATFVDYSASGTGFLVKAGNPDSVKTVADLCGKRVAAQKASNQQTNLKAYSKQECGPQPIEVRAYPENPQAVQAILAGNVDAVAATKVAIAPIVEGLEGKAEAVEDPAQPNGWLASPNAFGFLKADDELAGAYQQALQALIADGTYAKILARYEQEAIGLDEITRDKAID